MNKYTLADLKNSKLLEVGDHLEIFPLDNEHDLKLDYSMENAIVKDLEDANFDAHPWIPDITYAKVMDIYDGDTFHCIAKPQNGDGKMYRFTIRLRGIDTPELHGPEHERAVKAKELLGNLIWHKIIKLGNVKTEKYGRILAYVYVHTRLENNNRFTWDPEDVSTKLIKAGLGYSYQGGKKE